MDEPPPDDHRKTEVSGTQGVASQGRAFVHAYLADADAFDAAFEQCEPHTLLGTPFATTTTFVIAACTWPTTRVCCQTASQ